MSRRWVVTGGSRGIGLATAVTIAARGDRVAVLGREIDSLSLSDQLGSNSMCVRADVTSETSVNTAMRVVAEAWGAIDVLVNNAGLHRGGTIMRLDLADWAAVQTTNLGGPLLCIRAALPYMEAGASIINVGAVVGHRGFPGDAAYGAAKSGLAGLTNVLAVELARRGIRVNLVIPGIVITDMTSAVNENALDKLISRIPLRRVGTATEIADVIWWVAGSTYMTGATIPTDGGLMCAI